jgi:recombination protein RecA
LDIAADLNIVNKSGAWYSYNEERLGQGRENVKEYLKEHPEIANEIEQKVLVAHNLGAAKNDVVATTDEVASEPGKAKTTATKES